MAHNSEQDLLATLIQIKIAILARKGVETTNRSTMIKGNSCLLSKVIHDFTHTLYLPYIDL